MLTKRKQHLDQRACETRGQQRGEGNWDEENVSATIAAAARVAAAVTQGRAPRLSRPVVARWAAARATARAAVLRVTWGTTQTSPRLADEPRALRDRRTCLGATSSSGPGRPLRLGPTPVRWGLRALLLGLLPEIPFSAAETNLPPASRQRRRGVTIHAGIHMRIPLPKPGSTELSRDSTNDINF